MIINCVLMTEEEGLVTAGWDARVHFWRLQVSTSVPFLTENFFYIIRTSTFFF